MHKQERITHVASPTKSSPLRLSLSINLIFNSTTPSETVNRKVSFHSGLVPLPAYRQIEDLTSRKQIHSITQNKIFS